MKNLLLILLLLQFHIGSTQEEIYFFNEIESLDQDWAIQKEGEKGEIGRTNFPITIHQFLSKLNVIPDPFIGDNEKKLKWVEETNWVAQKTFEIQSIYKNQKIWLEFGQLEAFSHVLVNGKEVLVSNNSFISYSVDITSSVLLESKNTIQILFKSPVLEAKKTLNQQTVYLPGDERVYIRKPQFEFGWDWGPRLVTTGVKKPITLRYTPQHNFKVVHNQLQIVSINTEKAIVKNKLSIQAESELTLRWSTNFIYSDQIKKTKKIKLKKGLNHFELTTEIKKPKLWWPGSLGDHPVYHVDVVLLTNQKKPAYHGSLEYALCDIKLIQQKDSVGENFFLSVNGVPVYAKGYNIIPENYYGIYDLKSSGNLPDIAAFSNANMLRVWGGGQWLPVEFYNECQRQGLMIWQDFMYACAMYPSDTGFIRNIETETFQMAHQLMNFNNIAIWCGNNENDEGWHNWGWQKQYKYSKNDSTKIYNDYHNIFLKTIPIELNKIDTSFNYIHSSPQYGWGRTKSMTHGDSHYWGVWWGKEPIETFERKIPRFMSEFGMQAMPELSTLEKVIPKEKMNFESPEFKNHQKHPTGFETLNYYLEKYLTVPKDMNDYAYATQVLQAMTLKTAVEAQRRHRDRCMGSLIWQLNDTWPVCSWSVVDSDEKPKLAYTAVTHSFEPLLISIEEDTTHYNIYIVSDLQDTVTDVLSISINDFFGESKWTQKSEVKIVPNSSKIYYTIPKAELNHLDFGSIYLHAYIPSEMAYTVFYFAPLKELKLPNPKFEIIKSGSSSEKNKVQILIKCLVAYPMISTDSDKKTNIYTALNTNVLLPGSTLEINPNCSEANDEALNSCLLENLKCLNTLIGN